MTPEVRPLHHATTVRFAPITLVAVLVIGALSGVARGTPHVTVEGLFPGGRSTVTPGATPRGVASTDAASCATCHAAIAAEWRSSMHSASWTDEVFQSAYAVEPMAFCRNYSADSKAPKDVVYDLMDDQSSGANSSSPRRSL